MNLDPPRLFRALSDETRLRSLVLLHEEGDLCVCELTHALGLVQPKVSRHLATLREAGIVADRRQGIWIYYRIHPELPEWATAILAAASRGVAETASFAADRVALEKMPDRPGGRCCA
jgi:ArsR family transcriptional regulator